MAKKATAKNVGTKRAEARKKNREVRQGIAGLSSQQLINFFKGFDGKTLGRIEKAIGKVRESQAANEVQKIDQEIKALQERKEELKKGLG